MERQKVKRKLHMIKFDLETRAMMTSNQQKMQVTAKVQCAAIILDSLCTLTEKRKRWSNS